jgi:hypothetical protein
MKRLLNIDEDENIQLSISDIKTLEGYLLISEINYGIFVFNFSIFPFYEMDSFLYPLTSSPNKIYVEKHDDYQYQVLVTTVANNEVLIFEPIKTQSL